MRASDALLPAASSGTAARARSVFLAGAAALVVLSLGILPREPDERSYPVVALTSLPNGDGTLARYEWGGWLIWRAPATPVFIDGRRASLRYDPATDTMTVPVALLYNVFISAVVMFWEAMVCWAAVRRAFALCSTFAAPSDTSSTGAKYLLISAPWYMRSSLR